MFVKCLKYTLNNIFLMYKQNLKNYKESKNIYLILKNINIFNNLCIIVMKMKERQVFHIQNPVIVF